MIDETVVLNTAKEVFDEMGVDWEPVGVENDKLHGSWILSVHIKSAKKTVKFYILKALLHKEALLPNQTPLSKLKESMRRHVRYRMEKLESK